MATTSFVLVPPTGMQAAIEAHRTAWTAFQIAPEGEETMLAGDAETYALSDLVGTPCLCATDAEALALYLRWFIREEHATRNWAQAPESVALARATDLAMLLRSRLPVEQDEPLGASLGFLAARIVRRLSQCGELLACLVLIGGGMTAIGAATLIP